MKKQVGKQSFLAAVAAALVISLVGCSGNTAASSAAGSTTSTAAASSTAAATSGLTKTSDGLEQVTFVSPTALQSFDYLAIYAADHLGYFKEQGLSVKYVEQTGTDDVKMIATGQAQFGYPSPGVFMSSIDAGVTNVKAVANYDSVQIFGIAVNKKSGIKDWKDLKGKNVASYNESWSALISPLLSTQGMTATDVNIVSYGTGRYEACASGKAPALITWLSEYYQLVGQGYDLDYLDGNKICPQVSNSICTSDEMIKDHPDVVKKFVTAMTKAMYFCYLNQEAAADITMLTCPNLQIDWKGALGATKGDVMQIFGTDDASQKAMITAGIGKFDSKYCQNAADNLLKGGAITTKIDASQYYSNNFVDTSWDKSSVEKDAKNYKCSSKAYQAAK
jgi:ABC-type nitrate/sulfonate/bicarbonate transport system substrate-binding protein